VCFAPSTVVYCASTICIHPLIFSQILLLFVLSIFCVSAKYNTNDLDHVLFLCNISYLSSTVVDKLHRPATLVLDPNKDPSICITGGQFLKGLIPPHQHHLKTQSKRNKRGKSVRALHPHNS